MIFKSFHKWFETKSHQFKALILDIDGVLLVSHKPIPGSIMFLDWVRKNNFQISLLTNDGNNSKEQKAQFLNNAGLAIIPGDIISCGDTIEDYVQDNHLTGELFFIMGDLGDPCYAIKAGLKTTRELNDLPQCKGIIAGEEHYDWESVINAAVNYFIAHPEAEFIVPNPDEYFPRSMGRIHIGAGGVARFIKHVLFTYGIQKEPVYLGKPYYPIFQKHHKILEKKMDMTILPHQVLMIGDSLESDIRGAMDFNYKAGLFLTGITKIEMLKVSPVQPDFVFEGF